MNYVDLIKFVIKKNYICIIFSLLGLILGPLGFFAGFIIGFFLQILVKKIKEEQVIKKIVEDGDYADSIKEPFAGAIYVCAIGIFCCEDVYVAAKKANTYFGNLYRADWDFFCRVAKASKILNGDLLVECLASILLKNLKENSAIPIFNIFKYFESVEYDWNLEKGEKPSIYLANLLGYKYNHRELDEAYTILGLNKSASLIEVKKMHRKLASKYHPDKNDISSEEFMKIQSAYEKIINSSEK